jgi:hypothetical protein
MWTRKSIEVIRWYEGDDELLYWQNRIHKFNKPRAPRQEKLWKITRLSIIICHLATYDTDNLFTLRFSPRAPTRLSFPLITLVIVIFFSCFTSVYNKDSSQYITRAPLGQWGARVRSFILRWQISLRLQATAWIADFLIATRWPNKRERDG